MVYGLTPISRSLFCGIRLLCAIAYNLAPVSYVAACWAESYGGPAACCQLPTAATLRLWPVVCGLLLQASVKGYVSSLLSWPRVRTWSLWLKTDCQSTACCMQPLGMTCCLCMMAYALWCVTYGHGLRPVTCVIRRHSILILLLDLDAW